MANDLDNLDTAPSSLFKNFLFHKWFLVVVVSVLGMWF